MESRSEIDENACKHGCKHTDSSEVTLSDAGGQCANGWRSQMEGADMAGGMTVFSSSYAMGSVPGAGLTVLGAVRVGGQAAARM